MIQSEKSVKTYGTGDLRVTVLHEVDLTIKDGEFVAIVGPSGAGKSTLLYQLSLLDTPTAGEIYLDEHKTSGLNEKEKTALRLGKLGYVFQDYALLPELPALENVMLPMMVAGLSRHEARRKAKAKLIGADAELARGQEMPELMDEDEDAEYEEKDYYR